MNRAMLVYQAGIANVFEVDELSIVATPSRNAKRLYQGDFVGAANFARGLRASGVKVDVAACNKAGDVAGADWTRNLDDQPFSDKFPLRV